MTVPQSQRVAVVGAGISGVLAAAHLIAAGLDVVVFERNSAPGGVWLYDERTPPAALYPSMRASQADLLCKDWRGHDDFMIRHAPPGPCYYGLTTNVPTPLMAVTLLEWPASTPDYVHHRIVQRYIQDISNKTKVHNSTIYGARVQRIEKRGTNWVISWTTAQKSRDNKNLELDRSDCFSAVVVATGHYHAPRVPNIPGLSQVKMRWPSRVLHSKEYRFPEGFKNKNILIIGGGVSSVDIAKDISPYANTIYQSTRNSQFDLDQKMLPDNGKRVDEVAKFEIQDLYRGGLSEDEPLPISIRLVTGKHLDNVDLIMLCTGYHITLPFLQDYHSDETPLEEADDRILVTDGTQVHNLHNDIFYISDPTMAFVGLPYYTFTFSVFDFQAIAVAQVLSGIVELPTETQMRREYDTKVKEVGLGKTFHSIHGREEDYVNNLMSWVNAGRAARGLDRIAGFSTKWYAAKEALRQSSREQAKKEELLSS